MTTHKRSSFTILDILGKLGGIDKSLKGILGGLFLFLSKSAMRGDFARKLLLIKRKELKELNNEPLIGNPDEYVDVFLNMKTKFRITLLGNLPFLGCCIKDRDKLIKLNQLTTEILTESLDVL